MKNQPTLVMANNLISMAHLNNPTIPLVQVLLLIWITDKLTLLLL
jgi:hypothetical protein